MEHSRGAKRKKRLKAKKQEGIKMKKRKLHTASLENELENELGNNTTNQVGEGREAGDSRDELGKERKEESEQEENTGAHKNVPDNLLLFQYYKAIVQDDEEFAKFKHALHTRLRTTFRIGGDNEFSQTFLARMTGSPAFIALVQGVRVGNEPIPPPAPIDWYPGNKAWMYSVSGEFIRRSNTFEQFHHFLVAASNSGDIWRQEEASMIPPCFLDAKPTHKILDMCAAPGSKTAQIHDMVFSKRSDKIPSGSIIANDANLKRCLLLSQRLTKTSSPHILVTNHDAQHFPLKTGGMRLRFDRVLCDVPCSGDGTLRKLPSKAWAGWSTKSAFSLHALQVAIVQRGLELLGLNGKLVYSTCSMNPVENEAVVSAILQKFEGHVELVNVSNQIPGLKRNKGLKTWRIMDEDGNWYTKYEELPSSLQGVVLPTMFPKKGLDLSRCVRIFPQTQDTSGFFVTVFKVIKLMDVDQKGDAPKQAQQRKKRTQPPRFTSLWGDGPTNNHADLVNAISGVYQIGEFPWSACFARKVEISEKKVRNIVLFSDSLRDILQHNKKDAINVVHGGLPLFERYNKDFSIHNNFKLIPASLPYLSPSLGPKRVLFLSHPDDVLQLITTQRLPFSLIHDPSISQALKKLFAGYVVVKFNLETENEEEKDRKKKEGMVICRNGNGSLSLCASSSEVWSIKFLLNYT